MISKLIGFLWFAVGLVWVIRPSLLQNFLRKKSFKKIRRLLFVITFLVGCYFIKITFRLQGGFSKIIFILGVIIVVKSFFLFTSKKLGEKWVEWFSKVPLPLFRLLAGICIFIGWFFYTKP